MHTQYNISYVSCQINCLQSVFKHTKHRDLKCRLSTLQANSARYLNPPLPVSPRGKPGRVPPTPQTRSILALNHG
jgi:hypothetical protein